MSQRWLSLDVLRGMTMAAMILVNHPGSWAYVLPPLRHATWHGCTPTDLVFPFFLFIMGAALPLSSQRGASLGRIWRRTLTLIGLGLLLNGFPTYDWERIRLLGVLQRLGLCYLGAMLVLRYTRPWLRRSLMILILLGYAILLTMVPVPGGGIDPLTPTGNWGAWFDRWLLGTQHLYPFAPFFAQGDPESLLGTLPATVTVLLGAEAGLWLTRVARRVAWPWAGLGYGWQVVLPWNKPLWTSSYVLWSGGWAVLALAGLHQWIEVRGRQGWCWPWLVFGRNAILLFVGAGLLGRSLRFYRVGETPLGTWIFEQVFLPISRRFGATNPAELFTITPFVVMNYLPTICPLFAQLTLPLHENRSVDADYTEETATEYRKHTYHFEAIFQAIKVILLEGIDLLQRQFCSYYHLAFWIECGFATALERAIARAQEGLPPEETVKACETIYFPAQEIHFERDQPQVAATATINNDPRLG